MDIEIKSYVGYHGTSKESAKYIVKEKTFPVSMDEEEWLGKGVYFFENDKLQAIDWCTKARKYSEWAVIRSNLEVCTVVDLIDKGTYNRFKEIAIKMEKRYKTKKDKSPRKLINSVVLEAMYKIEKYDMVRAAFPVPSEKPADRTNICAMQIQLCVRNRNCIKTIEEVE